MEVKTNNQEYTSALQKLNLPIDITNISIYELLISEELNSLLEDAGYKTLGDLLTLKQKELSNIPNLTELLLNELETTLSNVKKQILDYYIKVGRGYFIEGDMQIYTNDTSNQLGKIYNNYPLIGNKILSKETLAKLNEALKIYVDDFFNGHSIDDFTAISKMQITLAIINLAKEWDSQDESSFWQYITLKIGYRKVNERLREFLCKCIYETLKQYQRWFIFTDNGNQYKSTVVAHAMSPKKSWYAFYDFIFDFYTDVLNWEYRKNDPLISKMVRELQKRISDEESIDADIEISGKIYEIREGIKKLIKYRPNYTNKLVNEMIEHIDKLVNKEKISQNDYLSLLCSSWYDNRLNNIKTVVTTSKINGRNTSLAFEYSRIRPAYELSNYESVIVTIPEIRLDKTDFNKTVLQLYINDTLIKEDSLSYYGNEFGKTLKHVNLTINEFFDLCKDGFYIRVAILCDNEIIYDSKQDLYRSVLCFQKQKEISIYKCRKELSYHIFVPHNINLDIQETIEANIAEEFTGVNCYYYKLGSNFIIKINDVLVNKDAEKISDNNIIYPLVVKDIEYTKEGKVYEVINDEEYSKLTIDNENLKIYTFRINNQMIDIENIYLENTNNINIYHIPLFWDEDNCCSVNIYDIEKNKQIAVKDYKLIKELNIRFSNDVFFEASDYDGAYVDITSDLNTEHISVYENDKSSLFLPWDKGTLEIKIPLISLYSRNNINWSNSYYTWNGKIKQDEYIQINCPDEYLVELFLGNNQIKSRRDKFFIGNDLVSLSTNTNSWFDLKLSITNNNKKRMYTIGHISSRERFKDNIRFEYRNNALYWNRGIEFIGEMNKIMKLKVVSLQDEILAIYQLDLENDLIVENPDIEIGEYSYEIVAESDDFFNDEEVIDCGNGLPIGEVNERRFYKKRIKIRYITEEDGDEFSRRKIKHTYIDNIKFKGIYYVGSEGRNCPIYEGIMYYESNDEQTRNEYSFEDNEENYIVNPVNITYIDSDVISIKNVDDEGLYYYRHYDKKRATNTYYITHRDPEKLSTDIDLDKYSIADLYIYESERI